MTQDMIRALPDKELLQVMVWGEQEQRDRRVRRKQETIATIRQLAAEAGVSISIQGVKGRPPKLSGVAKKSCLREHTGKH